MVIYVDQMFNSASESTSLADLNDGVSGTTGAYTPKKDGRLLKVIIFIGAEAATSLVEDVRIELTNTDWEPNTIMFGANGAGLMTAPAVHPQPFEYVIDQPVAKNSPIDGQLIHDSGSPVTSRVRVFGVFSA